MWYRKCFRKFAKIREEYWLTENGPEFANGEDNHEIIAEDYILNNLNHNNLSGYRQNFADASNEFYDQVNSNHPSGQIKEYLAAKHPDSNPEFDDYLMWLNTHHIEDSDQKRNIVNFVARELNAQNDPRTHMMRYYDWIRVEGNNIQVWDLNPLVLKRMTAQIQDVVEEENMDNYLPEGWEFAKVFDLEILSKGRFLPKVSYDDIASGDVLKRMAPPVFEEPMVSKPGNIPNQYYKYQGASTKR